MKDHTLNQIVSEDIYSNLLGKKIYFCPSIQLFLNASHYTANVT